MKIAIDIREAGKGKAGKGWYTFNLVEEIIAQGKEDEFILYTQGDEKSATFFEKHKNCQIKVVSSTGLKWHLEVLKDLKKLNPDLFFAPTSYIIPALAPKRLKTVITIHDLVAYLFPKSHALKATLIERITLHRALKKASAIFVVSENTKKDLLKRFRYPETKIYLTYCAAASAYSQKQTPDQLEETRKKLELPSNFVLAVGTLEPRKNFATLIKSFVIIKRKNPDYKLVIVGKKGWNWGEIDQAVKEYGLEGEVIFTGYLEDSELHRVYGLAKVFVFPSIYEGFGIPPIEAMASGCPVVSSNAASLPEVVGESGLLVDPHNALKIADAVCSLISNDSLRNMFIERGYEQSKKFNWKKSAETALEVFHKIKYPQP
ncbi:MAG TPA: glycosyltransferase family 1 protein [Candidatus Gracilibacteria bacterium]|nr:glycosyltransferase family 1 protein [Candidatus Gracilibacteria bacterium]